MTVVSDKGLLEEVKAANEIAQIKAGISWLSNLSTEALQAFLAAKKGSL